MTFQQIVLALGAFAFAGFGIALLIAPDKLSAVDVMAETPNARAEVRAMYGGGEIGMAIFLLCCVAIREWQFMGLLFQFLVVGGIALGRILAIVLERMRVRRLIYAFAAMEGFAAVVTFLAMR
ncbi:MAG TPA: DUF4345 family protein [Longimicrobiales bacterium]